MQHAWRSLSKVADQLKLLLGFVPRNNCRREKGLSKVGSWAYQCLPRRLQAKTRAITKTFSGGSAVLYLFASWRRRSVGRMLAWPGLRQCPRLSPQHWCHIKQAWSHIHNLSSRKIDAGRSGVLKGGRSGEGWQLRSLPSMHRVPGLMLDREQTNPCWHYNT